MKTIFKNTLKYAFVFSIGVTILFLLLVITAKIPREAIYENLKESAEYYRDLPGIRRRSLVKENETVHYYADSILLNIMYYINPEHPITSSMEARFYQEKNYDTNEDFVKVMDENVESNQQYIRYWHGSLSILTPLMIFMNIEQIYILSNVVFWVLMIILVYLLWKKYKTLAIAFIIASIMIKIEIMPNCIEYLWTGLIMLITSILSILWEKKGNHKLYVLYFITGIVTCYLDFLTTETLTILIPMIIVLLIRYKDERVTNWKEGFKFVIISGLIWFIGYCLMWGAKWLLASIILNINALDYVKENALLRLNANSDEMIKCDFPTTFTKNFTNLYPLNKIIKNMSVMILLFIFLALIYLILKTISKFIIVLTKNDDTRPKERWIKILLFLIGTIPYVRYLFLLNHSYFHSFFTYRAQMPTIIAIIFIMIYSVDKRIRKKLSEIIKSKKIQNLKKIKD